MIIFYGAPALHYIWGDNLSIDKDNNEICLGDTAVYTEADPSSVCWLLKNIMYFKI